MRHPVLAIVVAASAGGLAFGTERTQVRPGPEVAGPAAPGLLAPGPLLRQAGRLGAGPRLIAGIRVGRGARVDMAGTRSAGRGVLAIGCIDRARCGGSRLLSRGLYDCPPTGLDLWTVPGLRGGVRGHGWRALRRLVSDARPRLAVLYTSRGGAGVRAVGASVAPAEAYARRARTRVTGASGATAGWIRRVLPGTVVVEIRLPRRLGPITLDRHRRALRELAGLPPLLDPGPAGA